MSQAANGKDVSRYKALLSELDPFFSEQTVYASQFSLADIVQRFLYFEHTRREMRDFEFKDRLVRIVPSCRIYLSTP